MVQDQRLGAPPRRPLVYVGRYFITGDFILCMELIDYTVFAINPCNLFFLEHDPTIIEKDRLCSHNELQLLRGEKKTLAVIKIFLVSL